MAEKEKFLEELPEDAEVQPEKNGKKKIVIKKSRFIILIVLMFVMGTSFGNHVAGIVGSVNDEKAVISRAEYDALMSVYDRFGKLDYLYDYLKETYYKDLNDADMMDGIYKGLYESAGDPYTNYLTAEEYENLMVDTTGEFYGIGITFTATEDDRLVIISTMDGSPAANAGLRTGDYIVSVDGVMYGADEMNDAASAMRGELNTKVDIVYSRDGEEHEVTITRKKITVESVETEILDDNIGYIRISTFDVNTGDDFEKELRKLEMQGVSGLIIDLRNNGGGIVSSGTHIADLLLPEGTIIYTETKAGERTYYNSEPSATSLPYVLLVNEGTASTSEILSVAVKENEGGKLVGTNTFGKGIVQISVPLTDGSATTVTIEQYYSPDGNEIHGIGVQPDYVVELPADAETDLQLEKAIELLK
ncbi:MAG: S41 family peptidase [Clostridiales bacterium]|nr:S41 family peptidase [Clostridiales bacterium]